MDKCAQPPTHFFSTNRGGNLVLALETGAHVAVTSPRQASGIQVIDRRLGTNTLEGALFPSTAKVRFFTFPLALPNYAAS